MRNFKTKTNWRNRACLFLSGILLALSPKAFSQDADPLNGYVRAFVRSDLAGKIEIVRQVSQDANAPEFAGRFYDFALNFALENAKLLGDDPELTALTVLVVGNLRDPLPDSPGGEILWPVFTAFENPQVRTEIILTLSALEDEGLSENLNQYLKDQHRLDASLRDLETLGACIAALGEQPHPSSLSSLFETVLLDYPPEIIVSAERAMVGIAGNVKVFLLEKIRLGNPAEKLAALNAGLRSSVLTDSDKGELAETAMVCGLDTALGDGEALTILREIRYAAAAALKALPWPQATSLAIRHFYQAQRDFYHNLASRERLVDAIACLGAMGNSEAAEVIALQLGFINSQMEERGEYDDALTLESIQALGRIGDKIAFDYLLYTTYLPYPDAIQTAAKEALSRLKW